MITTGLILTLSGLIFCILLAILFAARQSEERAAARIARTPRTPASHAPQFGTVEIAGAARASEHGVVRSPGGRPAFVYRAVVSKHSGKHPQTLLVERERRPFYLDDGSGVCARLDIREGIPWVTGSHVYGQQGSNAVVVVGGVPTTYGPITAELAQWLQYRGIAIDASMRVEESIIGPGDHVFAIGPCRWQESSWQGREPVLSHLGTGESELMISNLTEESLQNLYAVRRKTRWILLGISAGVLLSGMLVLAVAMARGVSFT